MKKLGFTLAYVFLLVVLLPHTAWMFSQLEPPELKWMGWAGAIAFELTIALLTYFLAKEIAAASTIDEDFLNRARRELVNIPSFLLLGSIVISMVANWTHAYLYSANVPFGDYVVVRVVYSLLFGGVLPICSFAYAYVLAQVYRPAVVMVDVDAVEDEVWLKLRDFYRRVGKSPTPRELAEYAGVDELIASRVLTQANDVNILHAVSPANNGR